MVPPLHGVSSAASCSGTLDRGFIFHFRDPLNYSVVVVIWTFVLLATYTCPVIGARCCKVWGTHPVLKNLCFFLFQILILSYEPFISLSFFSHCPGDRPAFQVPSKFDGPIIFCMQTVLDLSTARVRTPWTLSRLCHDGKPGLGILNTRQGEVCMVAPPLLDVHDYFF